MYFPHSAKCPFKLPVGSTERRALHGPCVLSAQLQEQDEALNVTTVRQPPVTATVKSF